MNKRDFFKEFPEYRKRHYVCIDGPDCGMCVLDDPFLEKKDCTLAEKGKTKKDCGKWKLSQKEYAFHSSADFWDWIEKSNHTKGGIG